MDAQELRNLQEAYMEVYSVDEGLGSAIKRVFGGKKKEVKAPKPESRGAELRRRYNVGPEKSDTSAKRQILNRSRARAERDEKEFGDSKYSKSVAQKSKASHDRYLKAGYSKYGASDARGSGNKARRRAAALQREEYDIYDIILSHLLDEGYAETPEAAEAIMVNMSEEWRESIVENVSSGRAKVRNVKQRVSSAEIISNTQKQDKIAQHFADHAAKKKAAGDEAHAAATKSGKSPSDAETARQRAHRAYEKQLKRG